MAVQIVDHDAQWREKFTQQRAVLTQTLASWLAAPIEHVGSTAVPGLAAKPIIDILAPVTSLAKAHLAVPVLQSAGWLFWAADPNRSWRLWFLRPRPEARTHHLYLIQHDDPHIEELRIFRDLLGSRPELRQRYEILKYRLAQAHREDREAYTAAKRQFVEATLRGAGIEPQSGPRTGETEDYR
jgi:GrpB-like predicted nucleotidyltransferase (UPF0157 family)